MTPSKKRLAAPPRLDRRRLVLRFRLFVPSTRAGINLAVKKVLGCARKLECPFADVADVEIALREALANAVIHGNRNNPEKHVLLRCYGGPETGLFLAIRDEGEGFDPDEVPDPREAERIELPHGRGIFLMRHLMDHTHHRKGGREVVLFKKCGPQKPRKK